MLSLFTIWQSFQSVYNTSQNSFFRPQTDFQQQVNDISKELFLKWTGMSEKSQEIRDFLFPFLVSKNIIVKPRNSYYGFLEKPSTYSRWASARIWTINEATVPCAEVDGGKCKGYKTQAEVTEDYLKNIKEAQVDLIDEQRWAACLEHLTKNPTLAKPKMTQIDGGWRVAPRTVSVIALDWYKEPANGTFNYTVTPGNPQTGAGDFIQYDANNNTPLEWPETVINYFVWNLGVRYGCFISDDSKIKFSKMQLDTV
jgi:hypothetical protein